MDTQITSVDTMVVALATEVKRRDSNQNQKWMARNAPLITLNSAVFLSTLNSSRRVAPFPSTTGVIRITVHTSRQEAVTADGAVEYRINMEDMEMPRIPMRIRTMGCCSKYFISYFSVS